METRVYGENGKPLNVLFTNTFNICIFVHIGKCVVFILKGEIYASQVEDVAKTWNVTDS